MVTICHWIIRFTQTKANICITIGPIYVIAVARVTARYGPQMRSAVIGGICGHNFTLNFYWLLVRYQALTKVGNCDWCSKKLFFVYFKKFNNNFDTYFVQYHFPLPWSTWELQVARRLPMLISPKHSKWTSFYAVMYHYTHWCYTWLLGRKGRASCG